VTVFRKRLIMSRLGRLIGCVRRDDGNIAVMTALMLVPIIGVLAMGLEASSWFVMSRAAQNAADSAAVAAANSANSTTVTGKTYPQFAAEGWAAGRRYGFADSNTTPTSAACPAPYSSKTCYQISSNNAAIRIANGVTCPDNTATCNLAIVTKSVPIFLTRAVGVLGDTTVGAGRGVTVTSVALAEPISAVKFPSCITAMGSDGTVPNSNKTAISGNGTPNANAGGCSLSAVGASPSSIGCTGGGANGYALGALYGFATGDISGSANNCVVTPTKIASFTYCDPFAATKPGCDAPAYDYATAVDNARKAATSCTGAPSTFKGAVLTAAVYCYNSAVNLDAPITGASGGTAIIVTNGANVNLKGYSATDVTFIFGDGVTAPGSFVTANNEDVTITAPATGNLKGLAAYQVAPTACTASKCDNWTVGGRTKIDITGAIYLPYTNGSFGGNVQLTSSKHCFVSIFNSFAVNGTGYVLDRSGCEAQGLSVLPTVTRYRAALVK
jgi:Flp pilus assembly protein TadG